MSLKNIIFINNNCKMKRGSNASLNSKVTVKKPVTNQQKSQLLLAKIQTNLIDQIYTGKIEVSNNKKYIDFPKRRKSIEQSNPTHILQGIQESLKSLRSNMEEQKKIQREQEKQKLELAHQLIQRMKREKEEHRQKIREKNKKNVLLTRVYSDTTLNQMKQKLEERIVNKRKEIEERIRGIQERKNQRGEKVTQKQIQYWQKIKEIECRGSAESQGHLPFLVNPEQLPKIIPSSRLSNASKLSVHNLPSHAKYEMQINHYLQAAKSKNEKLKMRLVQERNESRLSKIIKSNQKLASKLGTEPSYDHNNNSNEFMSYQMSNHKLKANDSFKQALAEINKKISPVKNEKQMQNNSVLSKGSIDLGLEIQANQVALNKNQQTQKLKQKWSRVLSKIQHNQINQEQGLELLNSIEKRLDKIDFPGLKNRLIKKYQVFNAQDPVLVSSIIPSIETEITTMVTTQIPIDQ